LLFAVPRFSIDRGRREAATRGKLLPPALEGNTMPEPDGFPPAVAVWLGLAFAVALSLFTALAFGGFRWP
jgi:hypothetical protein